MSIKVGINGFGRIGRLVMRAAKNFPNVQSKLFAFLLYHILPRQ